MKTVSKCPVCDGTGLVSRPPHIAGDQESWTDSSAGPWMCSACNGTGIIFVRGHGEPYDEPTL